MQTEAEDAVGVVTFLSEKDSSFVSLMNTIQGSAMLRLTRSVYRFIVPRKPSSVITMKRTLHQNGYGATETGFWISAVSAAFAAFFPKVFAVKITS